MGSAAEGFALLSSAAATPISQLNPDLSGQDSRVVVGEVAIVWPYNSVTQTLAFLLAEPDVLLRRSKGQVRVQLRGSSANRVAECKLGGGDAVALCLDGVGWGKDNSPIRVPASRLDWQLEFAEKLRLEARVGDAQEVRSIDIDGSLPTAPPDPVRETQDALPRPQPDTPAPQPHNREVIDTETSEFKSPAFLKRARSSYGSLFEGALDIFEDDGGVRGRGRKRSRFGRDSMWKYASRSPSPENESPSSEQQKEPTAIDVAMQSSPPQKPQMTDGGCQTIEFDTTPGYPDALVVETPSKVLEAQQSSSTKSQSEPQHPSSPIRKPDNEVAESSHPATTDSTPSRTLFGNLAQGHDVYSMPRFGAAVPAQMDESFNVADRVRFGFSHQPQAVLSPELGTQLAIPDTQMSTGDEQYPPSYLDNPATTKYADMDSYVDAAEQEREMEPTYGYGMPQVPPAVETFERDQWDMTTQSKEYNPVEGGHFGIDALDEGSRITTGEEALHSDDIQPEQVPAGFDSYGGHDAAVASEGDGADEELGQKETPGETLVEDELDDEVGIGEDDAEYDQDGDVIEQGDYDQRQYDMPADDDEGESEEGVLEEEIAERYGEQDITDYEEDYSDEDGDEDGLDAVSDDGFRDGYEDEEDESEEDESEEDENTYRPWIPPTPRAAAPKEPVVISLLSDSDSDSEDDDVQVPKPHEESAKVEQGAPSQETTEIPRLSEHRIPDPTDASVKPVQHHDEFTKGKGIETENQQTAPIHNDTQPIGIPLGDIETGAVDSKSLQPPGGQMPAHIYTGTGQEQAQAPSDDSELSLKHGGDLQKDTPDAIESGDNNHIDVEMLDVDDHRTGQELCADSAQERDTGRSEPSRTPQQAERSTIEETGSSPPHSPDITREHEGGEAEPRSLNEQQEQSGGHDSPVDVDMSPAGEDLFEDEPSIVPQPEPQDEDSTRNVAGQRTGTTDAMPSSPPSTQQMESHVFEKEAVTTLSPIITHPNGSNKHAEQLPPTPIETQHSEVFSSQKFGWESLDSTQTGEETPKPTAASPDVQFVELPQGSVVQEQDQELVEEQGQGSFQEQEGKRVQEQEQKLVQGSQLKLIQAQEAEPSQEPEQVPEQEPVQEPIQEPVQEPEPMQDVQEAVQEQHREPVQEPETELMQDVQVAEEPREPQENGIGTIASSPATQQGGNRPEIPQAVEEARKSPSPIVTAQAAVEAKPLTTGNDTEISNASREYGLSKGYTSLASQEVDSKEQAAATPQKQSYGPLSPPQPDSVEETRPKTKQTVHEVITVKLRKRGQTKNTQETPPPTEGHRANDTTPDSSVQLARAALASKRGSSRKLTEPPVSPMRTRARSASLRISATPELEDSSVWLAKAAITSPSKLSIESESSTTPAASKAELLKRLRTELPRYSALKNIRNYLNKHVEVVAVVTTQPPEPQRAKRQYMMSFNITDPSLGPNHVVEVQFFRAHKEFLPTVKPGDSIILKHFQVVSLTKRGFGLRTSDESSWAVFDNDEGRPEIKGELMEVGAIESGYALSLKAWYGSLDAAARAKLDKANQRMADENRK